MRLPALNLNCRIDDERKNLYLETQQLKLRFSIDENDVEKAIRICNAIQLREDSKEVSDLLEQVGHLPLSVHSARSSNDISGADVRRKVTTWSSMRELLFDVTGSKMSILAEFCSDYSNLLRHSQVEGESYDALSGHSLIIESWRSLSQVHTQDFKKLETLQQSDEVSFFEVMRQILGQTFYITSHCGKALNAGTSQIEPIGAFVRQFMKEEDGHHHLIAQSLRELGVTDPSTIDVALETRCLMDILEFSARENPLALSVLLTFFEGTHLGPKDPFAELLEKSSRPRSAVGIQKHWMINYLGKHGLVGEKLSKILATVSPTQVVQSCQLLEAAEFLKFSLNEKILARIESCN